MRTLLDSSVWIEFLTNGPQAKRCTHLLEDPAALVVSPINLYEVGRYTLRTSGEDVMDEVLGNMRQCTIVPVDEAVAQSAVTLAAEHGLHMADALIAATARRAGAKLVSLDADLLKAGLAHQP